MFDILHDANRTRGEYASSFTFISQDNKFRNVKQEGHPRSMDEIAAEPNDIIHLGHNQAPTSAVRQYSKTTSHPFLSRKWIVAHNGVLTNFEDLNMQYVPYNKNPVDSSVIPCMLNAFKQDNPTIIDMHVIKHVLSLLEGTFALWIINADNPQDIYLARQGSTLFANKDGSFSSIQGNGWDELEEGKIYLMADHAISEIETFKNSSPFLVI